MTWSVLKKRMFDRIKSPFISFVLMTPRFLLPFISRLVTVNLIVEATLSTPLGFRRKAATPARQASFSQSSLARKITGVWCRWLRLRARTVCPSLQVVKLIFCGLRPRALLRDSCFVDEGGVASWRGCCASVNASLMPSRFRRQAKPRFDSFSLPFDSRGHILAHEWPVLETVARATADQPHILKLRMAID